MPEYCSQDLPNNFLFVGLNLKACFKPSQRLPLRPNLFTTGTQCFYDIFIHSSVVWLCRRLRCSGLLCSGLAWSMLLLHVAVVDVMQSANASILFGQGRAEAQRGVCVCVCHVMDEALQQLCCCCSEIRKYLEELSKKKEEELHIWYVSCVAARQGEEIPWVSLNTLFVSLNNFRVFRRQNFIMSQYI